MNAVTLHTDRIETLTDRLIATLTGRVVTPADPDWDAVRAAWTLAVDQRPAAVVLARNAQDVVATVRAATAAGLRVAPQSTGHNAAPLSNLEDTVLLRTAEMRGVEIDPARRVARVAAGTVWGEVTEAAAEHELTGLLGTAPDVGVVGYTLGGGLSWFARAFGLAANHVLTAEVVTADGVLRRVDDEHDPELFWAIRGGGGSFGVVTALEIRLFPVTEVEAGALLFPIERASEVLHVWRDLLPRLPDSVTSLGRLLRLPPLPELPEPLRGRSFVVVEVVSLAGAATTALLLQRLRNLGPEIDTVGPTPEPALAALHMDPPAPVPVAGDGIALGEFPAKALDAFLAAVGPRTAHLPLLTAEICHLGGALAPGARKGSAVSGLAADAVVYAGTVVPDADTAVAAHAALDALDTALAPWRAESTYLNFVKRPGARVHPASTLRRLRFGEERLRPGRCDPREPPGHALPGGSGVMTGAATGRLLVRGGHVLTLDPVVAGGRDADVLVEDGRIAAVGRDLGPVDADVLDARGTIVLPGFVDIHRHTWETVLRGMLPSSTLGEYLDRVVGSVGPAFTADDVYAGTLLGSLEALNAGVTTLVDWAHANNTPDHADEGIRALREAGIRAVYAHGTPADGSFYGYSLIVHPDAERVRSRHFSSGGGLLTFALALRGPGFTTPDVVAREWRLARELDARISVHVGMRVTGMRLAAVRELHTAGLLGPDVTYLHATTSTDEELAMIADSGGTLSLSPYVEMLMGHGHPPVARAMAHGLAPALSVDVTTSVPGEMFTQMRTALVQGRISAFGDDVDVPFTPSLTHAEVLAMATVNVAAAAGLGDRVGTVSPGKEADLVLLRADAVNTMPVLDPVATVVTSADTSNVDSVVVGGVVRKRHGHLLGVDLDRLRRLADESRDGVLRGAGAGEPARV